MNLFQTKLFSTVETLVMGSILIMTEKSLEPHANTIVTHIKEETGKSVAYGSCYKVLTSLQDRGFIASEISGPTRSRGGRSKTTYTATETGITAYQEHCSKMVKFVPKDFNSTLVLARS